MVGAIDSEEVLDLLANVFGAGCMFRGGRETAEVALVGLGVRHGGGVGWTEELGHSLESVGPRVQQRLGMVESEGQGCRVLKRDGTGRRNAVQ